MSSPPPGTPPSMDYHFEQEDSGILSDSDPSASDPESEFDQDLNDLQMRTAQLTEQEQVLFNGEDDEATYVESRIEHVLLSQKYIQEISAATLDNDKLDDYVINRLRNPEEGPVDISDPDTRLSLDLFMACNNASEATYNAARKAILRRFPDCDIRSLFFFFFFFFFKLTLFIVAGTYSYIRLCG
ncbi:hypothetical protein JOM56_005528, partial [Amanita muscaria]